MYIHVHRHTICKLKRHVSFAEYRLFYRALLQKRPIILRSLLIIAAGCEAKVEWQQSRSDSIGCVCILWMIKFILCRGSYSYTHRRSYSYTHRTSYSYTHRRSYSYTRSISISKSDSLCFQKKQKYAYTHTYKLGPKSASRGPERRYSAKETYDY